MSHVGPLNVSPFGPYKNPYERKHGPVLEGALKDRVEALPAQQVKLSAPTNAPTKGGRRRKIRKSRKNHKSRRNYKSRKNYRKYRH